MRAAAANTSEQSDFDQRKTAGNWNSILESLWSGYTADGNRIISTALESWLSSATAALGKGATIDSDLTLATTASTLNVKAVAGVLAKDLGITAPYPLTTSTGAADGLAASTSVSFNEANLVLALALSGAQQQYAGAKDVPEALSSLVNCDSVASALDGVSTSAIGCGAGCLSQLCTAGLIQIWKRTDAVAEQWGSSKLTLSCSGTLHTNANAVVDGYTGTWVGLLSSPSGNVNTGGAIN